MNLTLAPQEGLYEAEINNLKVQDENQYLQDSQIFPLIRLPPELRSQIWDYMLPGPRVILICESESRRYSIRSPEPEIPAVLQICSESRQRALLSLKPFFTNNDEVEYQPIYINPNVDILFLNFPRDFGQLPATFPEVNTIHTIAVPDSAMKDESAWKDSFNDVRLVLVTNGMCTMTWYEREYGGVDFKRDRSRKSDEKKWTRYIRQQRFHTSLNRVPDVQAVYECGHAYWLSIDELGEGLRE